MEKIRIRDKHPGSATLVISYCTVTSILGTSLASRKKTMVRIIRKIAPYN
jgi:hypothetical protein